MINAIVILYFFAVIGWGLTGYLLWALHMRTESLALKHGKLDEKVTEGEHVTIENFAVLAKQVTRLENEVKNAKVKVPKFQAKEAVKAARVARQHPE